MKEVRKELTIKSHNLHSAIMSFEDFSLSGRNIGHTNKSAIQAPPVHNLNKNCNQFEFGARIFWKIFSWPNFGLILRKYDWLDFYTRTGNLLLRCASRLRRSTTRQSNNILHHDDEVCVGQVRATHPLWAGICSSKFRYCSLIMYGLFLGIDWRYQRHLPQLLQRRRHKLQHPNHHLPNLKLKPHQEVCGTKHNNLVSLRLFTPTIHFYRSQVPSLYKFTLILCITWLN